MTGTTRRQFSSQNLEVKGAHVSTRGLHLGTREDGYSSLLYRPPLPAMPVPQLSGRVRLRQRFQHSAVVPKFLKRRFLKLNAEELREIYEYGLVTGLLRFFGEGAPRTLDNFSQIQPYTWYLHASAKSAAPVELETLRTDDAFARMRSTLKRNVTRNMEYLEACLMEIIRVYRARYQAQYGQALKKDHFGEKLQAIFRELPKPHDLRALQRQSNEARSMRARLRETLQKDVERTNSEVEYSQAEINVLQALMYSQLSVLGGYVPRHELMQLMDYIPPSHHGWFLLKDDENDTIVKLIVDKLEFRSNGRRLRRQPSGA